MNLAIWRSGARLSDSLASGQISESALAFLRTSKFRLANLEFERLAQAWISSRFAADLVDNSLSTPRAGLANPLQTSLKSMTQPAPFKSMFQK